jgi:hypothetical protein
MNTIYDWARRHGVTPTALAELQALLAGDFRCTGDDRMSEAGVQSRVRLEASQKGLRLWRNNVGACVDKNGHMVRYGLCNDSKRMNQHIKSSDLVGIRPVLIQPAHVGRTLGQFVAREVKSGDWSYSGSDREQAQMRFIQLVQSLGGDACFANSEGTL